MEGGWENKTKTSCPEQYLQEPEKMNTAISVLLYVWSKAVNIPYQKVVMENIPRKAALRYVRIYRTISTEAICVLPRVPPVKLISLWQCEPGKLGSDGAEKLKSRNEVSGLWCDARWKENGRDNECKVQCHNSATFRYRKIIRFTAVAKERCWKRTKKVKERRKRWY